MTSIAFSYKDFESTVQSPLKKALLLKVVSQNLKDQFADLYEYDVLKTLPLPFKRGPEKEAVIEDKNMSASFVDTAETASKLYDNKIEVLPNSIGNSASSATGLL